MESPRARGPYRGTARRRQEIAQEALEEFASVGYEAASLRSIAARVGMTHAGLLHHFPSKEELLVAILLEREDVERERLRQYAEITTVDALATVLVASLESIREAPAVARLWLGLSATTQPEHPAHAFVVRRYATWTSETAAQLEVIRDAGGLREGVNIGAAAAAVLAALLGAQLQVIADPAWDGGPALRAVLDGLRAG